MSGLEDLFAQIPTSDIANKIGVDEAEVHKAVQLLVPALVGGLHENAQDPEHASKIESAADSHAASGLPGGGGANSALLKQLLPILAPIVLAYVGKQLSGKSGTPAKEAASSAALNDVLGSILGGMGGNKSLGTVLGNALVPRPATSSADCSEVRSNHRKRTSPRAVFVADLVLSRIDG